MEKQLKYEVEVGMKFSYPKNNEIGVEEALNIRKQLQFLGLQKTSPETSRNKFGKTSEKVQKQVGKLRKNNGNKLGTSRNKA